VTLCPLSRFSANTRPSLSELDRFERSRVDPVQKALLAMTPPPLFVSLLATGRRSQIELDCPSEVVTYTWAATSGRTVKAIFERWTVPSHFTATGRERDRLGLYRVELEEAGGNLALTGWAEWDRGGPMDGRRAVAAVQWFLDAAERKTTS
jgi:hypothetical protein